MSHAVALTPLLPGEAKLLGASLAAQEPWSRYPIAASALETFLSEDEPGAPRFAIRHGNQLVGTVTLRLNWLRGPYIQLLGLLPEAQNLGIGAHVLAAVENGASTANSRHLWVAASDFNLRAIRFYERHGFRKVTLLENLVTDGRHEWLLRKPLR